MQTKLLALLILLCASTGCGFDKKCADPLVYDEATYGCLSCPKDATFKDGTCICKAGYDYVSFRCVKADAGAEETDDAGAQPDSGTSTGAGASSCQSYCSFADECIAQNALAGALSDIVMGLHADDAAACKSSCQSDLGNGEASNATLACFAAGKDSAMCKDPNPQTGLMGAFGLIGQCCGPHQSDPLCKSICKTLKANALVGSMVEFCP